MKHTFNVGGWVYDPETLVVRYGLDEYEVDLEQCSTSAQMLDWIFRFANKAGATPEAVGNLVQILNELLYCTEEGPPFPQGDALGKLIDWSIREKEIFDRWKQSMREKEEREQCRYRNPQG